MFLLFLFYNIIYNLVHIIFIYLFYFFYAWVTSLTENFAIMHIKINVSKVCIM